MSERRYGDPQALRQAITDRLRGLASQRPGAQLADLQRQFAYDRLLSRLFRTEPDAWVLKGATALLARLGGTARHTLDVDLYRRHADLEAAESALRNAASIDIGDFFRFVLSPGRRIAQDRATLRVPVLAYLGATEFAGFHVDLAVGVEMTGEPDEVGPLVPIELPGIVTTTYRVYPVADHLADKVCALLEVHPRLTGPPVPSTRYRDLVDLALLAHHVRLDAEELRFALTSEATRRALKLPQRLSVPVAVGWRTGYARAARDAPGLQERGLDSALATVRAFIDPILAGSATGSWDPDRLVWSA